MKVLIVGSGAREHSLAWKLSQEAEVFACPGNPGMEACATVYPEIPVTDHDSILQLAKKLEPTLVLVGPEDPLIAGLADVLRSTGFQVFGPAAAAAQLEGSKAFSKLIMAKAGVPTAAFEVFEDYQRAKDFASERFSQGRQVAIKASGAALGKGVVVCDSVEMAHEAIEMMMVSKELGEAGSTIVVEDRLVGREFSLITLVSGQHILSLPLAQDHKRALDGDRGPNTGGMGAYSPLPWATQNLVQTTEDRVVRPILKSLADEGIEFRGCLFSGLMGEGDDYSCLEYNVRFGDPECQTLMRLISSGLGDALLACAQGQEIPAITLTDQSAVTLSLCSGGYPGAYRKGVPIQLGPLPNGVELFHAGTKRAEDGRVVTAGGRVLSLTATGATLQEARELAYGSVEKVYFEGMHYRRDIAARAF